MELIAPKWKWSGNWDKLAEYFGYPLDEKDQDWTYTIVEPERIQDYIDAYRNVEFDDLAKMGLMEMIIQSCCDQPTQTLMEEYWKQLKKLLIVDFELHNYQIWYWCIWDEKDDINLWEIAPTMRQLWLEM